MATGKENSHEVGGVAWWFNRLLKFKWGGPVSFFRC